MSFTNVFGGSPVQPSEVRYRAISLTANLSLFWPQQGVDTSLVIARWNDVTPSTSGLTITFPSAETISTGQDAVFANLGSNSFSVLANDGTTIATVAPSVALYIINKDNSTVAGSWGITVFGGTASQVNAAALAGDGLIASMGQLKSNFPIIPIASNYTSTFADLANVLNWTGGAGTITLENAGVAGQGWFCELRNSGSGSVVVSPPTGTIDGASSKTYAQTESSLIHTDGVNYYTVGYGRAVTSAFTRLVVSVAGNTDVTLTSSQAANQMLQFNGALTGNINVIVPATVAEYFVFNNTSGAFTLTFKATGGTGPIVIQGQRRIAVCDGTNINFADTLGTGTVTQINSGTGLTGGPITATGTLALANTGVTPGSYTFLAATVNAQGQLTAASGGSLDTLGNNQGDMLYRNAIAWTVLPPGAAGTFLQSGGPAANLSWAAPGGRLLGPPIVNGTPGTYTYTPTAGTSYVVVFELGGGGGGGAVSSTGPSTTSAAGGGGAGGVSIARFTSGFSGASYTVGAGGAGGIIGTQNGLPGGATTFGTGPFLTANGGFGAANVGQNSGVVGVPAGAAGASGGSGLYWGAPTTGGEGECGFLFTSGSSFGGKGGMSFLGEGGPRIFGVGANGNASPSYGAGGGGAVNSVNQSAHSGGPGAAGLIVIWEYA